MSVKTLLGLQANAERACVRACVHACVRVCARACVCVCVTKEKKARTSPCGTNKSSFVSGLKSISLRLISMNINSIRGKKTGIAGFP